MFPVSPCLDIFFKDRSFPDRVGEIKKMGFTSFEFWSWWDKDIAAVGQAIAETGIAPVAFCTRNISLVDPSLRSSYLSGLEESIAVAKILGAPNLITQVGQELTGLSREKQAGSLVDGLKAAAILLEKAGLTLLVEPLNTLIDHKGYFLSSSDEAATLLRQVGSPKVKMLFDIYHQQVTEGNLINRIQKHMPLIGHFHLADLPGRGPLGTGEINYPKVLQAIAAFGYQGFYGLEFFPKERGPEPALRSALDMWPAFQ